MQPSWKPWARGSREHVWKKRDSELICQEVTILKVRNIRGTNRSGRSCYDMEEIPRYSNCGPGTSSRSLTMELLGNVKSQAVQTPWIQNLHPQVIVCTLLFEKHWQNSSSKLRMGSHRATPGGWQMYQGPVGGVKSGAHLLACFDW